MYDELWALLLNAVFGIFARFHRQRTGCGDGIGLLRGKILFWRAGKVPIRWSRKCRSR